jgi:hypothetical protein
MLGLVSACLLATEIYKMTVVALSAVYTVPNMICNKHMKSQVGLSDVDTEAIT